MSLSPPVLFLGFAVPDEMMDIVLTRDRYQPQIAAHKLQWNMIDGLQRAFGRPLDLLSAVPVSDYPRYPQVIFPYGKFQHTPGAWDRLIPSINITPFKHLTRFLACVPLLLSWLRRHREDSDRVVLIYSLHSPLLFAARFATTLIPATVILAIPDLPAFMDYGLPRSGIRHILKTIDAALLSRATKKAEGMIVLTAAMADALSSQTPALVVEGMVRGNSATENAVTRPQADVGEHPSIVYAGALVKENGLQMLLDAIALIPDKEYRFGFCGKGPMAAQIERAAQKDSRIEYWGFLSQSELLPRLRSATTLVHPRLSGAEYVKYSFPSKLLEYMRSGRPVIATVLPGIPSEYYDYLYPLVEETPEALARLLVDVCSKPWEELDRVGAAGQNFVVVEKDYLKQGRRIADFIVQMVDRSGKGHK